MPEDMPVAPNIKDAHKRLKQFEKEKDKLK